MFGWISNIANRVFGYNKTEQVKIVEKKPLNLRKCKKHIENDYVKLNFNQNGGAYLYFFVIKMKNKWCLKPGITEGNLIDRNYNYLYNEHFDVEKDPDTFRILAVCKFKTRGLASKAESLIKEGLRHYPLTLGQGYSIEQYEFYGSWKFLSKIIHKNSGIHNFPFSTKVWVRNDLDDVINIIMKESNIIDLVEDEFDEVEEEQVIRLKQMTLNELKQIPLLGDYYAKKIYEEIKLRNIRTLRDIKNISGIGDSIYNAIYNYLCHNLIVVEN